MKRLPRKPAPSPEPVQLLVAYGGIDGASVQLPRLGYARYYQVRTADGRCLSSRVLDGVLYQRADFEPPTIDVPPNAHLIYTYSNVVLVTDRPIDRAPAPKARERKRA